MEHFDSSINIFDLNQYSVEHNIVESLIKKLFPICRSITGNGVRKSLQILNDISEFQISEVPSGTKCFDWIIPEEWNIDDAFITNDNNEKIIDFQNNNLHVLNYSTPIDKKMNFNELKNHIHTNPDIPDAIPYRTSYYKRDWGFCLSHNQLLKIDKTSDYHVVIKSSLIPGSLTYGEFLVKGKSKSEFIFSTYCCHPSMANDNLSGMILWILLLNYLKEKKTKFSYRFLIMPETIGPIAYLSKCENQLSNVSGGFVLTCLGGPSDFSYKSTFLDNHSIDQIVQDTLNELKINFKKLPFSIRGSDERQFSSPGFRIPIGVLCKDKFHEFDYYHTSLDNLDFISTENILSSFFVYTKIIDNLEKLEETSLKTKNSNMNDDSKSKFPIFKSKNPKCEPMLSKRGLYPVLGGSLKHSKNTLQSMFETEKNLELVLNSLFYSDGGTTIEKISSKCGLPENELYECSKKLVDIDLLEKND